MSCVNGVNDTRECVLVACRCLRGPRVNEQDEKRERAWLYLKVFNDSGTVFFFYMRTCKG